MSITIQLTKNWSQRGCIIVTKKSALSKVDTNECRNKNRRLNKPDGATGKVLEKIGVPFPLEIMPAFSLGLGNSETRAAAESRIDTRNAKMYNRISARNNETAEAFAEAEAAKANLMTGMQPVFITNNNSTTNNSTNNSRSFVATGATTDPNGINLSQQVQP